jgi:hypothetical protein
VSCEITSSSAHRWNDAEAAAVITAFGNFQISEMFRRELDALRRHQVEERRMRLWQILMHRRHHFGHRMWAGHGQHLWMHIQDHVLTIGILLRAETAGDDHLAVFSKRFADRIERFLHGRIDEAAGIDDHQIGAGVGLRGFITFSTQLREYLFGIDQRLGAAE